MRADEFLLRLADMALTWQKADGSFPPGHNGPYHDPETPVRNSGHWLITFARCYALTNEGRYKDAIHKIGRYLASPEARPHGYSFYHRVDSRKDHCNGLIGPAWTIEALVSASKVLEDERYMDIAEDVFLKHVFIEDKGVWQRLEIDGRNLSVDGTFNHQLWFAACGALIHGKTEEEVRRRVQGFINKTPQNLTILENGLIHHEIEWVTEALLRAPRKRFATFIKGIGRALKGGKWPRYEPIEDVMRQRRKNERQRSIGYHAFNLYAFAMLKERIPVHPFWNYDNFGKSIQLLDEAEYEEALDTNKYGYPYNPPGFEVPYILSIFGGQDASQVAKAEKWINEQLNRCFNIRTGAMDRNTEDAMTHTARCYELTRVPDRFLAEITIGMLQPLTGSVPD